MSRSNHQMMLKISSRFEMVELKDILGKTVLAGIKREINPWKFDSVQVFGVFERMDSEAAHIRLEDGMDFTLPPCLKSVTKADPGEYMLKCSGERVAEQLQKIY